MPSFSSTLIALLCALSSVVAAQSPLQVPIAQDERDAYHIGMDLSASYG